MQDEELIQIMEKLAGPRPKIITLLPYKRELVNPGPKMGVYWTYSELVAHSGANTANTLLELYFESLTKAISSSCCLSLQLSITSYSSKRPSILQCTNR